MLCGPTLGDQLCDVGDPVQIENGRLPAKNFEDGHSSMALPRMGSQPGSKAPNTWRPAYENNFPLLSCKVTCHHAEQFLLLTLNCGEHRAQEPSRFFVHLLAGDMSAACASVCPSVKWGHQTRGAALARLEQASVSLSVTGLVLKAGARGRPPLPPARPALTRVGCHFMLLAWHF